MDTANNNRVERNRCSLTCMTRLPRWSQCTVGMGVPIAWQVSTTCDPRVAVTVSPSRGVPSKNRSRRGGGSDDVGWTTATIDTHATRVTTVTRLQPFLRPGPRLDIFRLSSLTLLATELTSLWDLLRH